MKACILAVTLLTLVACSNDSALDDVNVPEGDGTVTVFAPSAIQADMELLAGAYQDEEKGNIELTFAPNDEITESVRRSELDVFIGLAEDIGDLVDEGIGEGEPVDLGFDLLQIAVSEGNPKEVPGLLAFGQESFMTGLCPAETSCGHSGREALERAGIEPSPNVVELPGKDLLDRVISGEMDAALLFRSQIVTRLMSLSVLGVPEDANTRIEYGVLIVGDDTDARDFADWLSNSETADRLLKQRGLRSLAETPSTTEG